MNLVNALIALFALLISLVIHENAHGWVALKLGDDTALRMGRLSLNPVAHLDPIGSFLVPLLGLLIGGFIFGWAKPVPVNPMRFRNPRRDHALVAAAGPLSNLALALVSALALGLIGGVAHHGPAALRDSNGLVFLQILFSYGIMLNVLLALFNLIPLPPLDGSWILMTFLHGEAANLYAQIRPYGFLIVILLLSTGMGKFLGLAMQRVSEIYYVVVRLVAGLWA